MTFGTKPPNIQVPRVVVMMAVKVIFLPALFASCWLLYNSFFQCLADSVVGLLLFEIIVPPVFLVLLYFVLISLSPFFDIGISVIRVILSPLLRLCGMFFWVSFSPPLTVNPLLLCQSKLTCTLGRFAPRVFLGTIHDHTSYSECYEVLLA